ncbi:PAS domain-containing protein [Pontibacter sp. Tf4]|uniref:PAS domain-containing protein n=1 Tax=Pontibacter sp. Tf4 TaxID=2761620 RepID=UPI0016266323|nr:PAS domain-containing protein [Pontibacter sp. Tf4]MBB6609923.1 PAS domain-containing protein [Pontibacter sp. Tf4]
MPGLYAVLSPELTVLDVTDAYLKARNTTRESLIGAYFPHTFAGDPSLFHTPPVQALEQSLQQVLSHKQEHHITLLCFSASIPDALGGGTKEYYWSVTNTPVLSDSGELLYILHEAREASEKQARSSASQTDDYSSLLHSSVNAVTWEYDLVHNKMYWGPRLREIFGYTPEEMGPGGESWDERVHPDDFKAVQESIERANNSGSKVWTGEYRFRKADGSYVPVLDQGYIIYHTDGRAIRTLGSIIDLSENRKAETELKESDARFRHLLEVLPHMAWLADANGRVLYFNKNWYSYTGMSIGSTDGWTSVIHPEDTASVLTEWYNSVASGTPYEAEYRLYNHHDKTYRWFLERGVPMHGSDGSILYWLGTLTDMEEQKQALDRIREKDLQLENILNHSPVHLCLLRGPEHICQYITPGVTLLYGNRQYLNKPAHEIWPELSNTRFFHILEEVYTTGKTVTVNEHKLTIDKLRNGQYSDVYLNLEYRPLLNNGQPEGILATATEVTELVLTKQKAERLTLALQKQKSCL